MAVQIIAIYLHCIILSINKDKGMIRCGLKRPSSFLFLGKVISVHRLNSQLDKLNGWTLSLS